MLKSWSEDLKKEIDAIRLLNFEALKALSPRSSSLDTTTTLLSSLSEAWTRYSTRSSPTISSWRLLSSSKSSCASTTTPTADSKLLLLPQLPGTTSNHGSPSTTTRALSPSSFYRAWIETEAEFPGLHIPANFLAFPDRRPTRDQKFLYCPTEARPDPKLPENPNVARKPESGRVPSHFSGPKSRVFRGFPT